jgi:hypothetical protein
MLDSLRGRFQSRRPTAPQSDDVEPPAEAEENTPPFAGYDKSSQRELMDGFSKHSQAELEAADRYERSHKNRLPVLDKLRYMRGRQPIPGYDALSVEEINAALQEADLADIKAVRAYERKFANRPNVLDEVDRVHASHRAAHPAAPPPAYQSASANAAQQG